MAMKDVADNAADATDDALEAVVTSSPDQTAPLDCGRTIEEVWAGMGEPPDAHTQTCSFCQAARESLVELDRALRAVVDTDQDQPEPAVKDQIMDLARREARRGRRIPLEIEDTEGPSGLMITEQTVIAVATAAADSQDELRARRVQVLPVDDHLGAPPPARPASVIIRLRGSARAGIQIPQAAERLRDVVGRAVTSRTGLRIERVDVEVEDLHDVDR